MRWLQIVDKKGYDFDGESFWVYYVSSDQKDDPKEKSFMEIRTAGKASWEYCAFRQYAQKDQRHLQNTPINRYSQRKVIHNLKPLF